MVRDERQKFIAGGYFIALPLVEAPTWTAMPTIKYFVSGASMLMDFVHILWSEPEPDQALMKRLGLSAEDLVAIIESAHKLMDNGKMGWPGVFYELQDSQAFIAKFFGQPIDLMILDVAFQAADAEIFVRDERIEDSARQMGVVEVVQRKKLPSPNGEELGFEVLAFDNQEFVSWICKGIPAEYEAVETLRLNRYGLIESFAQAEKVAAYSNRECPSQFVERWFPCMILQYRTV